MKLCNMLCGWIKLHQWRHYSECFINLLNAMACNESWEKLDFSKVIINHCPDLAIFKNFICKNFWVFTDSYQIQNITCIIFSPNIHFFTHGCKIFEDKHKLQPNDNDIWKIAMNKTKSYQFPPFLCFAFAPNKKLFSQLCSVGNCCFMAVEC